MREEGQDEDNIYRAIQERTDKSKTKYANKNKMGLIYKKHNTDLLKS
jgi:hypothetical protein